MMKTKMQNIETAEVHKRSSGGGLNLPNALTVARMFLTPVFIVLFLSGFRLSGLIAYVAGCITDFLDGKIARKYNLITAFGKLADPVADKMLTTAALLVLMQAGYCSIYIVFIVLTREFAVTSMRLAASAQGTVIPANIWGKLKTSSQMLFTILIMLLMIFEEKGALPAGLPLAVISGVLLWITAVLAVISGVIYLINGARVIDFSK